METLDCAFYTSFYDDLESIKSNDIAINEHYIRVGKPQGRIPNQKALNSLISRMVHLEPDVYSTINVNVTMDKSLKTQWGIDKDWVSHYYGQDGNLYNLNKERIRNNNELRIFSNKWDNVHKQVFDVIRFKHIFYRSFYTIPADITTIKDLEWYWLKTGLFLKEHPNLNSLNTDKNIASEVLSILIDKCNVDVEMLSLYKNDMMNYAVMKSIQIPEGLNDTDLLLFLFLNVGYSIRIFFNKNEHDSYKNTRQKQYNEVLQSIKNHTYSKVLAASEKAYDAKSISLMKHANPAVPVPIIKMPFPKIIGLTNVVKLSNIVSLDCFKKIHKSDDLSVVIPLMIKHELSNCIDPVLNSMEVKILVTSIVYNAYIMEKTSKQQYNEFVKSKSVLVLTSLFNEAGLVDFAEALSQDIDFIIENKKVIKLSGIRNAVIGAMIQTFLLHI